MGTWQTDGPHHGEITVRLMKVSRTQANRATNITKSKRKWDRGGDRQGDGSPPVWGDTGSTETMSHYDLMKATKWARLIAQKERASADWPTFITINNIFWEQWKRFKLGESGGDLAQGNSNSWRVCRIRKGIRRDTNGGESTTKGEGCRLMHYYYTTTHAEIYG